MAALTGFYATSLHRADVRPKRPPLERGISKEKIRHLMRKSSIKLTPASALAIKEALELLSLHVDYKKKTMNLLSLPQEILGQVLSYLTPNDIVHFGRTCQTANAFIAPSNSLLWRTAFYQVFDDPQPAWSRMAQSKLARHNHDVEGRWNWHTQLRRRYIALNAVHPKSTGDFDQNETSTDEIAEILLEIIDTARVRPTDAEIARGAVLQVDDRSSLNIKWLASLRDPWGRIENFIHDVHTPVSDDSVENSLSLPGRPITRSMTALRHAGSRTETQSRLHVLYGRTARERFEPGSRGRARRIVYNWNNPSPENDYGPFKKDGSGEVDWSVIEATMTIASLNFELCEDGCVSTIPGLFCSTPFRILKDPSIPEDWAGVTGSWLGTYTFLDYADLFHFNTWNELATAPTLEDPQEAHGDLMKLNLRLDPRVNSDWKLQTKLPVCEDYPSLYFSGDSRSYDVGGHPRLMIQFRGSVSLCPGGREVRWRFLISYRGQDQWQLEGIQPGGIRSGPIYGTWTQVGHEDHSPVGAFMYAPEELCVMKDQDDPRRSSVQNFYT